MLEELGVTPNVTQHTTVRKSAVPDEIAAQTGYEIGQRKRKLVEKAFGCRMDERLRIIAKTTASRSTESRLDIHDDCGNVQPGVRLTKLTAQAA